jgi:hypothetical protein
MILKLNRAWFAAFGASMMFMGAHAYGTVQKPLTMPKSMTAKPAASAQQAPSTKLTGCLRMAGNQYELTHPKGSEVRLARTWRSGFIRKTAKSVEVVGASSSVNLKDHVGHEVSVVGTRSDETHLKARSISRVATSCVS